MRVKLKDITKFSKGTQINGKNLIDDGAYSYLNGGIKPSGKWNEFNVAENTVTISEGGNSSGYVNYMNEAFWCGAHCYYLYDGPKNSKYLYYALKSQQERLFRIRSGACMPNIKKSDLGNFIIEYEEDETRQEEVVKVLEKCELLIEDYNKKLALLDEAVRARFVEMFGDPSVNPMNWDIVNISEVVKGKVSNGFFAKRDDYIDDGNVSVMGVAYIVNRMYSQWTDLPRTNGTDKDIEKYEVQYGDMLFCRSSLVAEGIGKASIVPENVPENILFECHVIRLPLDLSKCVPEFMQVLSTTDFFRQQIIAESKTATMTTIGQNGVLKADIILPPISKQKEFYAFVKQVDKSRLLSNHSLFLIKSIIF